MRQIDLHKLQQTKGVRAYSKELEELVVLRKNQRWINANMHAVDAAFISHAKVSSHLINHVGEPFLNQSNYVFLGADVFSKLKLGLGSAQNDIQIYAPKRGMRMKFGKTPFHVQQIDVAGALNYNQELNSSALLWNYTAATELFGQEGSVTRLHIYPKQSTSPNELKSVLQAQLGSNFLVRTQFEKKELI